jgi:UDP-glucuronate 4-epimerase
MKRDFTYIDDIVNGVVTLLDYKPSPSVNEISGAKSSLQVFNIGNNKPVLLRDFISAIENALGKQADINFLPMQPGDVPLTYADIDSLVEKTGFCPSIPIDKGIKAFVAWYLTYKKKTLSK